MPISEEAYAFEQDPALARYSRQVLFDPVGEEGQRRLIAARVTLIGCGALGTVQASTLARAGVGFLRICDRDFIEENNLQRQILFDEEDIAKQLPKAEAARQKLARVNHNVHVEAVVADVDHTNIEHLAEGADLLVDGTDNFETRFLINDVAVKHDIPWVYGACISASGLVMPIIPGRTPCLRCIFESAPPPGMTPTCDTAGIIAPIVSIVAGLQTTEAIKILMGRLEDVNPHLMSIDIWEGRFQALNVSKAREAADCPCCKHRNFEFLAGRFASKTTNLCGRNAVQISPPVNTRIDFAQIAEKVGGVAQPAYNKFLLKFDVDDLSFTVFADGRAIIKGTNNADVAKTAYAKYLGN